MHGIELRHGLLVGIVVASRRERPLADIDDEERRIQAAIAHLGQVDLRVEPLRVVFLAREILGFDVVVGIEGDHAIMNRASFLDERSIRRRLRRYWHREGADEGRDTGGRKDTGHGDS